MIDPDRMARGAHATRVARAWPLAFRGVSLLLVAVLAMSAVIVVRHRENYRRLLAGEEPRFALPKKQATLSK